MSRRHWRKVKQALRRNQTFWISPGKQGHAISEQTGDIRKQRNKWRRNFKTASEWFPLGVNPRRVVRMTGFWRWMSMPC